MSARDLLWLAVLALMGYAAFEFLRALRAPSRAPAAPAAAAVAPAQRGGPREAIEEQGDDGDEDGDFDYAPVIAPMVAGTGVVAPSAADEARAEVFALQLENSRLRQELQAQKELVGIQQQEIARLVEDLNTLQDEAERARVQPTSSPEYSEAMVLAAQGLNAEMIAARCGITLAEAELVLSLARRGEASA